MFLFLNLLLNCFSVFGLQGSYCETCPSETVSGIPFNDIRLDVSETMGSCCEAYPSGTTSCKIFNDIRLDVSDLMGSCYEACP